MAFVTAPRGPAILDETAPLWLDGPRAIAQTNDAVHATVRAIDRGDSGIYNICDDVPVSQNVWLPVLARLLGAKPPHRAPAWLAGLIGGPAAKFYGVSLRGASNAKAKAELGITPRAWRDGFDVEFGRATAEAA